MNKIKLDYQMIYHLWEAGYSVDYITQKVGAKSRWHIREIIQKKFGHIEEKQIDSGKIFALRKVGWSVTKIAQEMKIPDAEVTKILIGEVKP